MCALRDNNEEKLNLSDEQFNYLIQKSDLKQVNKNGWSALIYALMFNRVANLNLNEKEWDFLIQKSDLKQVTNNGWTPLMLYLNNK